MGGHRTPAAPLLVVGDAAHALAGLVAELDADGPGYEHVPDADAALARLEQRRRPPACVACQASLPDRDGLAVLRRVGAVAPDAATVLLVDWAFAEELNRAGEAGVDAVYCHAAGDQRRVAEAVRALVDDRAAAARRRRLDALRAATVALVDRLPEADTRASVEALVPDVLCSTGPYGVAWTSAYDGDAGTLVPQSAAGVPVTALGEQPVPAGFGALAAHGPPGDVPLAGEDEFFRSAATPAGNGAGGPSPGPSAGEDGADESGRSDGEATADGIVVEENGQAVTVTVPLTVEATLLGAVHLVDDRAPSSAERRTLSVVGGAVARAIAATEDADGVSPLRAFAHELRNHAQVGRLHLAAARDGEGERHFDRATAALDRIGRLAEEAAALGRRTYGPGDRERLALRDVAAEAWAAIPSDGARLVVRGDPTVEGNEQAVTIAVENLLRNSVDHGGGDVTVRVGATEDGFYVEDTGAGLPPAADDRLFEPDFSTDDDRSGLGLAIVRRVVRAHGWTVEATESAAGGARFEVHTG